MKPSRVETDRAIATKEREPEIQVASGAAPGPGAAMSGRQVAVLAVLAGTQLIGVLDSAIVNLALPSISRDFHLEAIGLQWVVSAFVTAQAAFFLLGGRLCDAYKRKRVFIVAVVAFGLASLAGGLAPSPVSLDTSRAVQGLAGAVLATSSLALVTQEFDGGLRNRALAIFGTVAGGGYTLGVVAGGALTGFAGWRSVFFINVPLALLIAALSSRLITSRPVLDSDTRLDLAGAAVGAAAIVSFVIGLTQLTGRPLLAAIFLAVAAAALAGFVMIERIVSSPLMPLQVFRSVRFSGASAVAGLTYMGFFATAFTITFVVQQTMSLTPQVAGLLFVPAGFASIASGAFTAAAIDRFGRRLTIVGALSLVAVGTAIVLFLGIPGSAVWLSAGYMVAGLGTIPALVSCTIAVTSAVDVRRVGLASGVLNTLQFVCSAVGTAAAGLFDTPATRSAYGASLMFAIAVVLVAIAVSTGSFATRSTVHKLP